jgi:Spy/CpxP family protein refolding chaperone
MKKRILIPALIVGVLLTGSLALAGPGKCGSSCSGGCDGKRQGAMSYEQHEEQMGQRLEAMGTILDLTEEQKNQFETLVNKQWQEKQPLREQMQASRDELREAKHAANFDETDFRAKAARHAELKTEMMVAHAKMKQEMRALLTPEQQEKADKLGGMMGGHNKGHHGGQNSGF